MAAIVENLHNVITVSVIVQFVHGGPKPLFSTTLQSNGNFNGLCLWKIRYT